MRIAAWNIGMKCYPALCTFCLPSFAANIYTDFGIILQRRHWNETFLLFFFFFYKKSVLFQMDFAVSSWTFSPLTRRWAMMSCSGTHELQYENIYVCKMEDMEMNYLIVWSKAGCLATRWYLHNKVAWYKLIMVVTVHQADSVFLH